MTLPLTAILAILAVAQVRSSEDHELEPGKLEPYPWVEESETLRVPKAFLSHLEFDALEHTEGAQIPWSNVSWKLIHLYRLTDEETKAVNATLRKCDREVRFTAGMHMKPLEQEATLGRYQSPEGLKVLEQRQFALEPHLEARQSILEDRDKEMVRILGTERAERLSGHSLYKMPAGSRIIENTALVTFRRIEIGGVQSVDRVMVYPDSGSYGGGPFFEEEDEFAPESLKPVLQRWRAAIGEFNRTLPAAAKEPGDVRTPNNPVHGQNLCQLLPNDALRHCFRRFPSLRAVVMFPPSPRPSVPATPFETSCPPAPPPRLAAGTSSHRPEKSVTAAGRDQGDTGPSIITGKK